MKRNYFGTDGIRGQVGQEPITPDFALRLGNAVGRVLRRTASGRSAVLIGKDTRVSGYMLESALEAGFAAAGCDVTLVGPMPTAGVAYLTRTHRHALGVVISASHNVFSDNGIKFFSSEGDKLPDQWEQEVEQQLELPITCLPSEQLGKARRMDDAAGRYIEFCKSTFPPKINLRGVKLVVDCAHGAAYHIAPGVFHELGAEVITIGDKPDGFNINHKVGATAPQAMLAKIQEIGADYGIALDGDADRLQLADASGRLFDGDELLLLLARHRKPRGVVGTLMTNMAVEKALQQDQIGFVRAKVGDRYVLEQLKHHNWVLGGEGSGHLLCLDKHSTGDGVISALQVLAALIEAGKTPAQYLHDYQPYTQVLINVKMKAGTDWQTALREPVETVDQALRGQGRTLIRASGTEPLLRIMVEALDAHSAKQYANDLATVANKILSA